MWEAGNDGKTTLGLSTAVPGRKRMVALALECQLGRAVHRQSSHPTRFGRSRSHRARRAYPAPATPLLASQKAGSRRHMGRNNPRAIFGTYHEAKERSETHRG